MKIDSDYPGGNMVAEEIGEEQCRIRQDIRDSGEWWFYWNFRVTEAAGRRVLFRFTDGEVLGPYGPAVSADGFHWQWLGAESLRGRDGFVYSFSPEEEQTWFSFSFPYQVGHLERFCARIREERGETALLPRDFGRSEAGRPLPWLQFGAGARHIVLTCRHHACESTASYVLEGAVEGLLDSKVPEDYTVDVFPMADIDGVEAGDQGKARLPHDHNRDYIGEPLYAFCRRLMAYARVIDCAVFTDFHSPWKWGGKNDQLSIVKSEGEWGERQDAFARILERVSAAEEGPLYRMSANTQYGEDWNAGEPPTCTRFFMELGTPLALSLENPYFETQGVQLTPERLRQIGRQYAAALERYLEHPEGGKDR